VWVYKFLTPNIPCFEKLSRVGSRGEGWGGSGLEYEMEQEDSTTDVHIPDPLLHACTEVQDAMAEFEEAVANEDIVDVESMIENLNEDQRRVFNRVNTHLQAQHSSTIPNQTQPLLQGKVFLLIPH